jgi:hypothetical protein
MRVFVNCTRGGLILLAATVDGEVSKGHPALVALANQIVDAVLGEIELQKAHVKKPGDSSYTETVRVDVTCHG